MTRPSIWTSEPTREQPAFIGAHRGASSEAGENSAAAFEQAIAAGADFIELDWRLTRDGKAVAFHDETLERLHGDPRRVEEVSFTELMSIGPDTMAIPDVLDLTRGRVSLLLDTKITDPAVLAGGLKIFASGLRDDTVAFGARTLAASRTVREHLPGSPVLGLFRDYADYPALKTMGGIWARLWEQDASADAIARLQAQGLKVIIMAGTPTTGGVGEIDAAALAAVLDLKPDAVMLNDIRFGLAIRDVHATDHNSNSPGG